jgi:hypothetical protein
MNRSLIAVCRGGLYKLDFDKLDSPGAEQESVFGIKIPWVDSRSFVTVTPADFYLADNTTASVLADGKGLIVYSSGKLDVLRPGDEKLVIEHSTTLAEAGIDGDGTEASLVQMNSNFCVLARDGLPVTILTAQLEPLGEVPLPGSLKARQLAWIPGTDQISIVTHTGELLKLDCQTQQIAPLSIPYAGSLTSINWLDSQRAWVGAMPNRAYLINVTERKVEQSCAPRSTTFEMIYSWIINPLYLVNPKPSALDNTMTYLLSGEKTMTTQLVTRDLEAAQVELQVWQPIFSNLAFVVVIIGISCIYVARKEF